MLIEEGVRELARAVTHLGDVWCTSSVTTLKRRVTQVEGQNTEVACDAHRASQHRGGVWRTLSVTTPKWRVTHVQRHNTEVELHIKIIVVNTGGCCPPLDVNVLLVLCHSWGSAGCELSASLLEGISSTGVRTQGSMWRQQQGWHRGTVKTTAGMTQRNCEDNSNDLLVHRETVKRTTGICWYTGELWTQQQGSLGTQGYHAIQERTYVAEFR